MNIRVALVDDHPMMRQGLQSVLLNYPQITICGIYSNGDELLEGLKKECIDVLLLDIQLPGKTGEELTPVIRKKYPDLKILALTNFNSTLYANNMFKHGAHGYLLKTSDEKIIIEAIETVYKGGIFIEKAMQDKMDNLELKIKKSVSSKSLLTPREKEVLQCIVDGDTNAQIAKKLFLSIYTVENYRDNVLLKLDVQNTAALVKKALQLGLADL